MLITIRARYIATFSLITVAAILLRYVGMPHVSGDMQRFLLPWYFHIVTHGGYLALGENFTSYTPPYLYLITLMTYLPGSLAPIIRIKLIATIFDFGLALGMHELIRHGYGLGLKSLLAYAAVLVAPTIILNSSYWGQADSIYTAFLLICLYFICKRHYTWAVLAFSVALAFKVQAIFLLPFLVAFFLKVRLSWPHLFIPGIVYSAFVLPTVLLGRPLIDVFSVYSQQADSVLNLNLFTPNLYALCIFDKNACGTPELLWLALILSALATGLFVILVWRSRATFGPASLILLSTYSVTLLPFLLPRMHDRYFYPADVLSIALAFFQPRLWWLPVMFQISSVLAYSRYLWDASPIWIIPGAVINFASLLFLSLQVWKLTSSRGEALP